MCIQKLVGRTGSTTALSAIAALTILLSAGYAKSDTIYLKNGRSIEGIIKKETDTAVELDVGGGSVGVNKSEVKEIKRSAPADAEKIKREFERKDYEMSRRKEEFSEAREKRFSEYAQWQDEERAKSQDRASESKDIQAAKDQRSDGIIVEAVINNNVRAVLLVDTGASLVLLSKNKAAELGIDLSDTKREVIECVVADGRKVKAKTVVLESLSVQGAEEKGVLAAVPLEEVPGIQTHDGLLGMSYLGRFNIKIDRATLKINLEKTGKKK